VLEDIAKKYASRGRKMASSNRKQALIPQGAEVLPNRTGTAPGIIWQPRTDLTVLTFPGVPSEMQQMWQETAVPFLQGQGWGREIIYSRTLKFWGISESALAQKVGEFLEMDNPTVAPYASRGEVKLRISGRATSEAAAMEQISPVEAQIRAIAAEDCFGADEESLASVVGRLVQQQGQTFAVAESCTGGGLGQMVTAVPGSSDYFLGGVISYDNGVKVSLLGVNAEDLAREGAVSATVAKQMAIGVRQRLGASWGVSITGIAGPGGATAVKPVGLVYIGVAGPTDEVESFEYRLGALHGRDLIRHFSACSALDRLRRKMLSDS
jgi:nicotinamide-nucleotide amidase